MTSNPYYFTIGTSSATTQYTNYIQTTTTTNGHPYPLTSGINRLTDIQYFYPCTYNPSVFEHHSLHEETEQQKAERLRLEKIENEKEKKLKIEREEAQQKAKKLLLEFLSEKNKQRYFNNEPIIIESNLIKGISYHIPISYSRIEEIKNSTKEVLSELCIQVEDSEIPLEDNMLTKLLHVTYDERNMLKTAKHWNVKQNLISELN